ncbi:Ig-like domain-containing protein [Kitasatospora sp. NPDC088134]|uniref:Ig-like domain-containing protein n=1 Tax=Kitasatospora sp. NPDC088134 TaxID=3364071 RepID=UPI0037FA4964
MFSARRLASLAVPALAAGLLLAPAAHAAAPRIAPSSCSHSCHSHAIGRVAHAVTTIGSPVVADVLAADGLPGGAVLNVYDVDHGTVVVNPDSTIRYTPAPGFVGKDCLYYTARTPGGVMFEQKLKIEVLADSSSVTSTLPAATTPGTPVTVSALVGRAPGTVLTAVDTPAHGTAVEGPGSTVVYTPEAGFSGTDTFLITVQTPDGGYDVIQVTVQVACP